MPPPVDAKREPVAKRKAPSVLSNASIYLGANILNAAIPFFLLPVLTRVLAPSEYGRVAMFEAVVACFGAIIGLSTHGAVGVRFFQCDQATFARYVGTCLLILVGSSLLIAVVVLLMHSLSVDVAGLGTSWLMFGIVVAFGQFLLNLRLAIWQSNDEPLKYGVFQVLQTALNGLLSLFLVLYLMLGSEGRILGFGIAVAACGALALASMQMGGWIRWGWNHADGMDALKFGLPLIPHTVGTLAVSLFDRFIITERLGVESTGIYFAAVQLSMPMLMLGSGFNRAFVPWLFARLAGGENARAVAMSYGAVVGFLVAGMLYGLFVNFGLSLIVGDRYYQSKLLALVLIVGTTFQAAYYAVVNYIFYSKRTIYLSLVTFLNGSIYVVAAWFVAARYGLRGVALLFAGVQCLTFALTWVVSARVSPQPWLKLPLVRKELGNLVR